MIAFIVELGYLLGRPAPDFMTQPGLEAFAGPDA